MFVDYLLMATYGFLVVLVLRNILQILVRQKEFKNVPILAFYSYTLLAVNLRLINVICGWTSNPVIVNIDKVQQGAKICVGITQDWITFELAIRIHIAKGNSDISSKAKRKLRLASALLFVIITLAFSAYAVIVKISAEQQGHYGIAFFDDGCLVSNILGICSLSQVFLMILLVAWLFVETQRAVNRERQARQDGKVSNAFWRERCTYAFISLIFALSYIGRFILNFYFYGCGDRIIRSEFAESMTQVVV